MKLPGMVLLVFVLILGAGTTGTRASCDLPPPVDRENPPNAVGDPPVVPPPPTPPGIPTDGTPPSGTPRGTPTGPELPGAGTGRPGSGRGRGPGYGAAWRTWWELNREHLLGLRKTLPTLAPASGGDAAPSDARDRVRQALRDALATAPDDSLRTALLRALGRSGRPADAELLLRHLLAPGADGEVQEGAAIGIASLSEVPAGPVSRLLRRTFEELLAGRDPSSSRARLVAILALSLRARTDPALVPALARFTDAAEGMAEASALLYSCGLAREPLLGARVREAAITGRLGGRTLADPARSHAVLAVAMTGEAGTEADLARLLLEGKAQVHTRRSVALALGLLLREERVDPEGRAVVEKAVAATLADEHDPLVRGWLLLACGQARPPVGPDRLLSILEKTADAGDRPYAALALALAAPGLDEERAAAVRKALAKELPRTRDIELGAALSVACGLAKATEARAELLARAADPRLNPSLRGPALEGLGLMGDPGGEGEKLMLAALDEASPEVVEDAAIALGFIGRGTSARLVVEKLRTTKSDKVRAHLVVALSHLGGEAAIGPLVELLEDRGLDPSIRESAAAALGILADPREVDPLFEIDACSNPYGLTTATRELVRIY